MMMDGHRTAVLLPILLPIQAQPQGRETSTTTVRERIGAT